MTSKLFLASTFPYFHVAHGQAGKLWTPKAENTSAASKRQGECMAVTPCAHQGAHLASSFQSCLLAPACSAHQRGVAEVCVRLLNEH